MAENDGLIPRIMAVDGVLPVEGGVHMLGRFAKVIIDGRNNVADLKSVWDVQPGLEETELDAMVTWVKRGGGEFSAFPTSSFAIPGTAFEDVGPWTAMLALPPSLSFDGTILTFNSDQRYEIEYSLMLSQTVGNNRTEGHVRFLEDIGAGFVAVPSQYREGYHRNAAQGSDGYHSRVFRDYVAGNQLKVAAQNTSATLRQSVMQDSTWNVCGLDSKDNRAVALEAVFTIAESGFPQYTVPNQVRAKLREYGMTSIIDQ